MRKLTITTSNFSPDGTEVKLNFGDAPIGLNLGWGLTASISDLSGAAAWDRQHTPKSQ